jgi:hypothetical protein
MSIKKLSFMLLSALSLAALLNGCGSSNKEGNVLLGGVASVPESQCRVCHGASIDPASNTPIVTDYLASIHYVLPDGTPNSAAGCQGCHGGGAQHNGVGPIPFPNPLAPNRCNSAACHNGKVPTDLTADNFIATCSGCHGGGGIHSIAYSDPANYNDCLGCHAFAQTHPTANVVKDNNSGVRAITAEFSKWSHHVTGVNLQNAHCAACHLEGKADNGKVVIDRTYHMADNKTHLRNADTDADMQWDPAAPNHTTMDDFCMSCHDANGATSPKSAAIRALMIPAAGKTASASNPFGDTISNRYDKMQRPAVVDASSQFNVGNNSHHAVKGKRYSGRTRAAGTRQIASPATFANNSSALLQGERRTMFDAGNLNQLYVPLENAAGEINVEKSLSGRTGSDALGDDSTLHCGDCHTVGQWRANGPSTTRLGALTPVAIGAHGSNNEYLLRNSIGTDERHTQNAFTVTAGVVTYNNPNGAFLVCYNCHSYDKYGSIFTGNGVNPTSNGVGPHAGEYDSQGRCNGVGNTLPFNGYTTGTKTDGTQFLSRFMGPIATMSSPAPYAGEQNPDFGNIFGIQCNNCHNSGVGNAYGGIHGSAKNTPSNDGTTIINPAASVTGGAYIDGLGNTTKHQRFLPGLGNTKYVPGTLGGYTGGSVVPIGTVVGAVTTTFAYTTGGITNDTNWEQRYGNQVLGTVIPKTGGTISGPVLNVGAGCYTLGGAGSDQRGPSVTGAGGAATPVLGTWGGCQDHNVQTGQVGELQFKRVVRPVTY